MKKFLILYCATPETMKYWSTMTPEEGQKGMEEWGRWQDMHKADLAEPGCPAGKNSRLTAEGMTETSNEVCGYSVLQADSKEGAQHILADNPHLQQPGTYLEVMELMQM